MKKNTMKRLKRGQTIQLPGGHGSIKIQRGGAVFFTAPRPKASKPTVRRNGKPRRKPATFKKTKKGRKR